MPGMAAQAVYASPAPWGGSAQDERTVEDKQVEKSRLRQMVDTFVKKALKGCPCVYFEPDTNRRIPTYYKLQPDLSGLCVMSSINKLLPLVTCPLGSIEDIFACAEDGESAFPSAVLSHLDASEKERLLQVSHSGSQTFTFLEETVESRDMLLECLRILCIYAQATKKAPTARVPGPEAQGTAL